MKTCPGCHRELLFAEFNFKNRARGRLQVYCRTCSRAYVRDHYWRNKQYYIDKATIGKARYLERVQRNVLEYLALHPCVDCGQADPALLEFDHIDRSAKEAAVGEMIRRRLGWRIIRAEIEKCLVRCANCHRRRTAQQFGWYRLASS
ncbi:MAG TPA: hypothetical protein VFG86_04485 [Chloroflexota bacterium]|nr:hypothetical protein [Chloroflexota bacterium]